MSPHARSRALLVAVLAIGTSASLAHCTRRGHEAPAVPATRGAALRALARCTFDEALRGDAEAFARDASRVESALRAELRTDRRAYALRSARCEGAVPAELRTREPTLAELHRAVDELRALAQGTRAEDIALERSVRHVGNAWRAAAR